MNALAPTPPEPSAETTSRQPPPGMWANGYGAFVPEKLVPPASKLEDQLVRDLLAKASDIRAIVSGFRATAFEDIDALLDVLAEKYQSRKGAGTGNTTLMSYDGLRRVQVATGDFQSFGPELQVAKSLIDECLTRWTEGSGDEIKALVNDAFDVGKEGKIRSDRVLGLRRLEIKDDTWVRAMAAIGDAVRTTHSKRYVRFYERASYDAEWRQVSLDLSKVTS